MSNTQVYISVPMTADTDGSLKRLADELENGLSQLDYDVINPTVNVSTPGLGRAAHLQEVAKFLEGDFLDIRCSEVVVLVHAGEVVSWGCGMEAGVAWDNGVPILVVSSDMEPVPDSLAALAEYVIGPGVEQVDEAIQRILNE
jgi:hypothetical protein